MGKTIRNYEYDGLKKIKSFKKSKPRKKHIKIEDFYEEECDSMEDFMLDDQNSDNIKTNY